MRYTLAYKTASVIAFVAAVFLIKALVGATDGTDAILQQQVNIMYAIIGAGLLVTAVQFVLMGHLLTEVRDLQLPNRECEDKPNELTQASGDSLPLWEVTGIDKDSGFETTIKIRAENKAKAGVCALTSDLSIVNTIIEQRS